jgi:DNA-binding FrmR family transcriptional regulator
MTMKLTGSTQRRTALNSWQRQSHPKHTVLQRIRNITGELEAVQTEIHNELTAAACSDKLSQLFADASAVQALNDCKAELDQLRRILWFYIEQATGKPAAALDTEQQTKRQQHVSELLRVLAPRPAVDAKAKPSVSFFERLDVVIDNYMQEKKPVAPAKTSKPAGSN